MSKNITTIQNAKFCAFCKYWWDHACKYIAPYMGTQWCYASIGSQTTQNPPM